MQASGAPIKHVLACIGLTISLLAVESPVSAEPAQVPALSAQSIRRAKLKQVAKFEAPSSIGENRFGYAVALSDDGRTALIGARGDQEPGLHSAGAAFVHRRINGQWVEEAKLVAPTRMIEGFFGVSVALSADGGLALVGASAFFAQCETQAICGGAAHFFRRNAHGEWVLVQTLTSPDGGFFDAFGSGVALSASGRTAVIGAQRAGCSEGSPCGAAFVFEQRNGSWQFQQRLSQSVPDPFVIDFGTSVSLSDSGKSVLIGAFSAAYAFRRQNQGWSLEKEFKEPGYAFGRQVALSGDGRTAAIGSAGAASVFRRVQAGWGSGVQLPAIPLGATDVAVAVSHTGKRILLGASPPAGCESSLGNCLGILFEANEDGWVERQILTSSDQPGDNSFGDAVALSGTGKRALIGGAFQACISNPGECNGAAYLFECRQ